MTRIVKIPLSTDGNYCIKIPFEIIMKERLEDKDMIIVKIRAIDEER